jgi:hypothetical protein
MRAALTPEANRSPNFHLVHASATAQTYSTTQFFRVFSLYSFGFFTS